MIGELMVALENEQSSELKVQARIHSSEGIPL